MPTEAVIFDLDGVLVDSEQVWNATRERFARESGGHWEEGATRAMMGMSSTEWSSYMHDALGVPLDPADISREVARRVADSYRQRLPLLPGAQAAVERLGGRWPLGLASSSNREVIDLFLELSGLGRFFGATVSSEEVARGKPAPDVYLAAAERLGVSPGASTAVEDSTNGLKAAHAAGMRLIAIPNAAYPPSRDALALADAVLESLEELDVATADGP